MNQPPKNEQLKAVLFDMDGVLYDSMNNHAETWIKSFAKFGIPFHAREAYLHEGRTGKKIIALTIREREDRDPTAGETEDIYAEKTRLMNDAPPSQPVTGIHEVIDYLRDHSIKVLVVTGSQQPSLLDKLNHDFGVSPDEVVAARDVERGKPHPEPYLQGLQIAGTRPDETIVIENAPLGVESARGARIFTVALNTGILADDILKKSGADVVLKDGLELLAWFRENVFRPNAG